MKILGLKDVSNKKLIYLNNFKDKINCNYLFKNNNVYSDNYNFENTNNYLDYNNCNFEILTFNLYDSYENNLEFKKIKCVDNIIFTFNFIQRIIIQISINSKLESFDFKFQVGGSFSYNDDNYLPQIYPVNAVVEFIDSNICFYINYGIVDDFKNYNLDEDCSAKDAKTLFTNQNVFSNYTYIDINKEFM